MAPQRLRIGGGVGDLVRLPTQGRRKQEEVVEGTERLALEARGEGGGEKLIGIAYVAIYEGGGCDWGAVGDARDSPIFARGLVLELQDHLSALSKEPRP